MGDDRLKAMVDAAVERRVRQMGVPRVSKGVIESVRDDGRVNVVLGGVLQLGITALDHYRPRSPGDVVQVLQWGQSLAVVQGKVGAGADPNAGGGAKVSRGVDAPTGPGWTQGTTMWVRPQTGEVYQQTAAPATEQEDAALSVPVDPTADGVWQSGHRTWAVNDGQPVQGAANGYPANQGGWFYEDKIVAAVADGRTPKHARVGLSRRSYRHGDWGQVRPRVYLIGPGSPTAGTPTRLAGPITGPGMGLGSSVDVDITDFLDELASGADRGLAVYAGPGNNGYIHFTPGCGRVTIDFT